MTRTWRIYASAAAISFTMVVGFAAPAEATFPGKEGLVAYVLPSDSHRDIWVTNPQSGSKKRLTTSGRANNPRWSADGKHIAYNQSGDLWIMNPDGTGKRQATSTGKDLEPAWSTDGKQLVFVRIQSNGRGDLFRMPSAGGTAVRITSDAVSTGGDDRPTWSPTRDQILFEQYDDNARVTAILTVSSLGGSETVIPASVPYQTPDGFYVDAGYKPDFTPDGNHVLFLSRCDTPNDCLASTNVTEADFVNPTRTWVTGYDGYGEDDQLHDYATSPGPSLEFAVVDDEGFNIHTQKSAFIGLNVGGSRVAGALLPDWQPKH